MHTANLNPLSIIFSSKKLILSVLLIALMVIGLLIFTPGVWIAIGVLIVSVLAVMSRLEEVGSDTDTHHTTGKRFTCLDGGTSRVLTKHKPRNIKAVVHDGGSFERSRSESSQINTQTDTHQ